MTIFPILALPFLCASSINAIQPACQIGLLNLAQMVQENPNAENVGHQSYLNTITAPEWGEEVPKLLRSVAESGNANLRSPSGFTALQAACLYGDVSVARFLVAAGADVNARPAEWQKLKLAGNTPIGMLVCFNSSSSRQQRLEIAKLLLDAGADPDAPIATWRNIAPFDELRGHRFNDGLRSILLRYGNQNMEERTKGWNLSWRWYQADVIRTLLNGGVHPDSHVGEKGYTLLAHIILRGESPELIRLAIEKGAKVAGAAGKGRYTPPYTFMIPVYGRHGYSPEDAVAILRLLLDNGASIDALNIEGESLRIHYGRINTSAARALGAELRARGAALHPDAKKR